MNTEQQDAFQTLLTQWSATTSQREMAALEQRMWSQTTREERRGFEGFAQWARKKLGKSQYEIRARSQLHLAGDAAEDLWARIDGTEKMLITSAAKLVGRAKVRAMSEACSLGEAIARELHDYDSWIPAIQDDGGTYRKRPMRPRGFARRDDGGTPKSGSGNVAESRALWAAVRAAIKRLAEFELRRLADTHTRDLLRGQLEAETSGLMDQFRARIDTAKRRSTSGSETTIGADDSGALRDACELLSVDAPRPGEVVTHVVYMTARKHYKALVREYHPDHGGDVVRYRAVVEAMRLIEESYQNQHTEEDNKS